MTDRTFEEIVSELSTIAAADRSGEKGRSFSYVFDGPNLATLTNRAMEIFSDTNGLDPTVFQSFVRFENDLIGFAKQVLNAPDDAVGTVTSGGTESIILAVKAARDEARSQGITQPNMVLAWNAHPAYLKAAHLLAIDVRRSELDAEYRADVDSMADQMDENTVFLVAGAPSYAHGVLDPIKAISQLAMANKTWLHVDACVGGFVLPFLEDVPVFDFRHNGVRSVSADLHKYGYAPKGSSLVVFRTSEDRSWSYFATADWNGYPVVNPGLASSRPGSLLAAAWATVQYLGEGGYRSLARRAQSVAEELIEVIDSDPHMSLVARPDSPLLAVTCKNAIAQSALMQARGWVLGLAPRFGDSPPHLHLTITAGHEETKEQLIADLRETASEAAQIEPPDLSAFSLPEGDLGPFFAQLDLRQDAMLVSALLNEASPQERAALASAYVQALFS